MMNDQPMPMMRPMGNPMASQMTGAPAAGGVMPVVSVGAKTPPKSSLWDLLGGLLGGGEEGGKNPGMMDSLMGMLGGGSQKKADPNEVGVGGTTSAMAKPGVGKDPAQDKVADGKKPPPPEKFTFGLQLMPVQAGSAGDPAAMMHPDLVSPWAKMK